MADTIITQYHNIHPPTTNFLSTLEVTYSQVWYIIRIISSSPTHFHSEIIELIWVTNDLPSQYLGSEVFSSVSVCQSVILCQSVSQTLFDSQSVFDSQAVRLWKSGSQSNFVSQSVRLWQTLSQTITYSYSNWNWPHILMIWSCKFDKKCHLTSGKCNF